MEGEPVVAEKAGLPSAVLTITIPEPPAPPEEPPPQPPPVLV